MRRLLAALVALGISSVSLAEVPRAAVAHRADLIRTVRAVWGMDAPVAVFAAQIHQESAWRPTARSPVGALGMAQFMPTTATWIVEVRPELGAADPFNPKWAMRAMAIYDLWIYERVRAADACQRWAFTLSAYNGGLGWVNRDKALASSKGLDPLAWFGSVERVNSGRSAANWHENRTYPDRILYRHQRVYVAAGWGEGVCL